MEAGRPARRLGNPPRKVARPRQGGGEKCMSQVHLKEAPTVLAWIRSVGVQRGESGLIPRLWVWVDGVVIY